MRVQRPSASTLFVAVLPLMLGCSAVSPPQLTVGPVATLDRGQTGGVMYVEITAENPNKEPIPLREFTYSVEVDGAAVFEGVRSAESTLRRFGERTVILPVAIPALPADRQTLNFRIVGQLSYREPGALAETLLDVELIDPSVAFSGEGSIQNADLTSQPRSPRE